MKIQIQVVYKKVIIDRQIIDDCVVGCEIVRNTTNQLTEELGQFIKEKNFLQVSGIDIHQNPHYMISCCDKPDCEFKKIRFYDLEDCLDNHPEFVKTIGPYHLIGVKCRVIPQKFQKYLDVCKEATKMGIRTVEVVDDECGYFSGW